MERGAQLGGKGLIAFRGRVRMNTTEVSTGWGGGTDDGEYLCGGWWVG